jgi:RNA polymerase-binding transcription factor DksA
VSTHLDESLRALRSARLDAIDRALEALADSDRRDCLRCRRPIEIARLRDVPDARICAVCAEEAARSELAAEAP